MKNDLVTKKYVEKKLADFDKYINQKLLKMREDSKKRIDSIYDPEDKNSIKFVKGLIEKHRGSFEKFIYDMAEIQKKDYERYISALAEDFQSSLSAVAEVSVSNAKDVLKVKEDMNRLLENSTVQKMDFVAIRQLMSDLKQYIKDHTEVHNNIDLRLRALEY